MNRFLAVLFLAAAVCGQAPPPPQNGCGCAPAPTIIQLSCGGNGQGQGPPPPPAPAPAPAQPNPYQEAENYFDQMFGPSTDGTTMQELMSMCEPGPDGRPKGHPAAGFPEGFRYEVDQDGFPTPIAPEGFPGPSEHWDGTPQTLGFPMPARGTAHFNMLMCWPIQVPVI